MWKSILADQSQSFEETYSAWGHGTHATHSGQDEHVTHLRYNAVLEETRIGEEEFGVNTKLILQKHISDCQNTKATDAMLKNVTPKEATPTPVESKTNVLCKSTADGKKLENLHSLKSNEMAECSSVKPGEEVDSCQRTRFRIRTLEKCQCGDASSTSGPGLTR